MDIAKFGVSKARGWAVRPTNLKDTGAFVSKKFVYDFETMLEDMP